MSVINNGNFHQTGLSVTLHTASHIMIWFSSLSRQRSEITNEKVIQISVNRIIFYIALPFCNLSSYDSYCSSVYMLHRNMKPSSS